MFQRRPGLLVLDVGVAALADAGEDHFTLVGDAVAVGVGPFHQVVGVGFAGQDDAVLERQHHARRDHLVDEHRLLVVVAVALGALPAADPADRIVLARGIGVHHVADHFDDVHAAVAVELDDHRADDVGVRRDQLHPVAGRQDERLRLVRRRARQVGRLGGEVGQLIGRRPRPPARAGRPAGGWPAGVAGG